VELLDDAFSTFDRLADEHGLEKIKTIGDAYMVAGSIRVARPTIGRPSPTWRSRCFASGTAGAPERTGSGSGSVSIPVPWWPV